MVITIDGPSGCGKSTAAKGLARRFGYLYLDTGAMYRAVALAALRGGIPLNNRTALARLASACRIVFKRDARGGSRIFLNGSDVTNAIRHPKVEEAASVVATNRFLRRALVAKQRRLGRRGGLVAEGRDTGTAVFPQAHLKVYLTASLTERAMRRYGQLQRTGHRVSLTQVIRQIKARDLRDRRRAASPLRIPRKALRIDNSRLKSDQVLDILTDYVQRCLRRRGAGVV